MINNNSTYINIFVFVLALILLYISRNYYGKYYLEHTYISFILFHIILLIQIIIQYLHYKFNILSPFDLLALAPIISSIVYIISYEVSLKQHSGEYIRDLYKKQTKYNTIEDFKNNKSNIYKYNKTNYYNIIIPFIFIILLYLFHRIYNKSIFLFSNNIIIFITFLIYIFLANYKKYSFLINYSSLIDVSYQTIFIFYIILYIQFILIYYNINTFYYTPFCAAFLLYLSRKISARIQLKKWDYQGLLWPVISITLYYIVLTYNKK